MDARSVEEWVAAYVSAWGAASSNSARIAALFSDDAVYFPEPHDPGWRGASEIVAKWWERDDPPGTFTVDWKVVAVDGDLGVVEAETRYIEPPAVYSNIWLVRLDQHGRCTEFKEWWMARTGTEE